jgi:hypothetical protein
LNIITKGKIDAYPDDWKEIIIPTIDFQNKSQKASHDRMVKLVEQMLQAQKKLRVAKSNKDVTFYERQCQSTDIQINNLVYEIYDLTNDEISIIEN